MRLYAASFPQTGDITHTDISVDTENRKRIVRRIMKRHRRNVLMHSSETVCAGSSPEALCESVYPTTYPQCVWSLSSHWVISLLSNDMKENCCSTHSKLFSYTELGKSKTEISVRCSAFSMQPLGFFLALQWTWKTTGTMFALIRPCYHCRLK